MVPNLGDLEVASAILKDSQLVEGVGVDQYRWNTQVLGEPVEGSMEERSEGSMEERRVDE